jgi:hypothetical protein
VGEFWFILIALAVALIFQYRRSKAIDAEWGKAAARLGLKPALGGFLGNRRVAGTIGGFKVVVVDTASLRKGGKSKAATRYRVVYPPLDLDLKLRRQRGLRLKDSQDIRVGDKPFDKSIIVQGRDPDRIRIFLTQELRYRILRIFKAFAACSISDREIRCTSPGVESSSVRLDSRVRALVQLAQVLCSAPAKPRKLERALRARRRGNLKKALEQVREVRKEEKTDTVAKVAEAEILYASREYKESAEVLEEVKRELPGDEEVPALAEDAKVRTAMPQPAPVTPPPSETSDALESHPLLFQGRSSVEVQRVFEEQYADRMVRWSGELERVESFASDFVFGTEPGTRAVVELYKVEQDYFGVHEVMAVLQLPPEAEEALASRVGERIEFEGRLVRVDPFVRNLFLADARVL